MEDVKFYGGDGSVYRPDGYERHLRHVRVLSAIEKHGTRAIEVLSDPEDIRWANLFLDSSTPDSAFTWDAVPL